MTRIAWINDFKTGEITGGNNKTSTIMINAGRERDIEEEYEEYDITEF